VKYLLDTNICIYLMKEQPLAVIQRFSSLQVGDVGISSITLAELEHGVDAIPELAALRRTQLEALVTVIPSVPFDDHAAKQYGFIRNGNKQPGRNRFDTLIAAQALAHKLVLVTNNLADFTGIPGLVLENWIET
jgi:tRNA(fMet)-specific endonuclease VapC